MDVKVGDRVVFGANEQEGWKRIEATVLSVEENSWGVSLVCEGPRDPDDPIDDGLFECTLDQVEEILP